MWKLGKYIQYFSESTWSFFGWINENHGNDNISGSSAVVVNCKKWIVKCPVFQHKLYLCCTSWLKVYKIGSFSLPKKRRFYATQEVKGRGNSNQLLDKVDHLSKLSSVLSTLVTLAMTVQHSFQYMMEKCMIFMTVHIVLINDFNFHKSFSSSSGMSL